MTDRKKQWLVNGCLALCSVIVMMLILEFFLRFSGIERLEHRRPHLHQPSDIPGVHFTFVPNLINERGYNWERISTNSLGFRGPEPEPDKPSIAILGDSFAFGFGLNDDQTQAALLREEYSDHNVHNLGVNGYNIEQIVRAYEAIDPPLDPDLAILEFVWNDMKPPSILTDEKKPEVYALDGFLEKEKADEKLKDAITKPGTLNIPFKFWLTKNSAVFNFLEKRTKWLPFRAHFGDPTQETISDDNLKFYQEWFSKLDDELKGAQKIFVIWPEPNEHVDARPALKKMASNSDWIVIDLYDTFGLTYPTLTWDWHPNAKAHHTVSELIIEAIQSNNLL